MKKYQSFISDIFQCLEVKFSIYLNRLVFVMIFKNMKPTFRHHGPWSLSLPRGGTSNLLEEFLK